MKGFSGETEAIQKAKRGDIRAQRALYDLYRSSWFMICLRYFPNRADAEDALQNGLINIFTKLDQFDADLGAFGAWTSRIIANECILLIRKNNKHMVEELGQNLAIHDPGESILDKITSAEIIRIIQQLPTGYRTIFNMIVFEGYSHKEVANQLNISEGTSKSQLFKARKMLQEALEVMI